MISIHKKLSLAKESISVSQGLKSSCLALAVYMLAFVFIPYIVADVNAETAEVELDWTKVVLELDTGSNSGNVAFNNGGAITPDEAGKVATASKTLTVNTTGKHFNVYLSMDSSVGNNNKLCYDFDASDPLKSACTHTGMGVNPVIENSASPAALTGNDWGYALNDGETGFSSAGTYSNVNLSGDIISSTTTNSADLALYNAKWAAVPLFGSEDVIWTGNTNNANGFGTTTIGGETYTGDSNNTKIIVYGVKINNNLVAGNYGSKILYTAVASASDLNTPSTNIVSSLTLGGPTDLATLYMDIDAEGANIKERNITVRMVKHSDAATADSNSDGKFTEVELSSALNSSVGSCLVANNSLELGDGSLNFGCVLPDLGLNEGTDYDFIVEIPITGGLTRRYISYKTEGGNEGAIRYVGLQTKKNSTDYYVDTMQGITAGVCAMTNVWGATVGSDARIYNRTGTGVALANSATDSLAIGTGTFQLEDIRDNKEYLVRRLADGNCWMVQNLDLELADFAGKDDANGGLTPANTDLNSEESKTRGYWDPSASVVALTGSTLTEKLQSKLGADQTCSEQFQSKENAGSGCYWGSKLSDDGNLTPLADVTNNANATIPRSYDNGSDWIQNNPSQDGGTGDYKSSGTPTSVNGDNAATLYMGNWYNWYAATAESGTWEMQSGNATDSICPAGWQLPDNSGDHSWVNLLTTKYSVASSTDGSRKARNYPLSIIFSGDYYWVNGDLYNRGAAGFYWSSAPYAYTNSRDLGFHSTVVDTQSGYDKTYGLTVRCVARGMDVTTVAENDNYIAVENTSSNGNTDETKRYTAKGDSLTLSFDLEDGIGTVNENNVSAYLVPHATVANAKYKVTDSITNGANNYPQCEIGNDGITVDGSSVTIDCTVDNSASGSVPAIVSTTASSGTDRETSNGYYDIWVHVPASGEDSDYLSKTLDKSGNAVASLAFAGLQSHSDNNASSSNYVVSSMQDMTASVCKNTNMWGTGYGDSTRVYDYTGSGTALADSASGSAAIGTGTFLLADVRETVSSGGLSLDGKNYKSYLVRRLADGNCWMVQNLDYDLTVSSNRILNPATSDVASNKTLSNKNLSDAINSSCSEQYQSRGTFGDSCKWGSMKDVSSVTNNADSSFARSYNYNFGYINGTSNTSDPTTCEAITQSEAVWNAACAMSGRIDDKSSGSDDGTGSFQDSTWQPDLVTDSTASTYTMRGSMYYGDYYNWYAATAESGNYNMGTNAEAEESICPRGWRLPVNGGNDTDKSWQKLIMGVYGYSTAAGYNQNNRVAINKIMSLPLSVPFAGHYEWTNGALDGRGYDGNYWSSTATSTGDGTYAYYLFMNYGGYLNPQSNSNKTYGLTVRCVAR